MEEGGHAAHLWSPAYDGASWLIAARARSTYAGHRESSVHTPAHLLACCFALHARQALQMEPRMMGDQGG